MFWDNFYELCIKNDIKPNPLARKLGISSGSITKWKAGGIPNGETLIKIADYFNCTVDSLLGRGQPDSSSITDLYGYSSNEEEAMAFPAKLAIQMDYNSTGFQEIADALKVSPRKILEWLSGESDDYSEYLKPLSAFFDVEEFYWTTPGAVSPGIVLNTNEYILILLMREYQRTGRLNSEMYGDLESYFPGLIVADTLAESKLLTAFRNLTDDNKDIIIGEIKKLLKEQRRESVAADPKSQGSLKEAK